MEKKSIFKNKDVFDGIILAILSIFFINESFKLHGNNQWSLSPALFPLIVASLVLIFSISQIIKGLKDKEAREESKMSKENFNKLIGIIIISFVYLFLLPKLHFLVSSILYLLIFMYILGERNWKILLGISIITPLLIQYVFGTILDVYLP